MATRHPVDEVEQVVEGVDGEVFKQIDGPAGFATKCTLGSCWGLTRSVRDMPFCALQEVLGTAPATSWQQVARASASVG